MLKIDPEALIKLEELHQAEGGENSAIRIAVMGGGKQGPGLGLVVDEQNVDDILFDEFSIPIVVDRNLMDYCRKINIEFRIGSDGRCGGTSGSGFLITTETPLNF